MYQEWGFSESPFETTALPPTDQGSSLLVGRDGEVAALVKRINNGPKFSTIEGLNGVGKTSIVNVTAYRLFKMHLDTGNGPLFVPCRKIFQLNPHKNSADFVDEVLMEVAQTLIEQNESVRVHGHDIDNGAIARWLNSPQLVTYQAGIGILQAGAQAENNTGNGFERSGFRKAITTWLQRIFPSTKDGGVICTIDNLELLLSSDEARKSLEQLRDELFNIPGLRWVLCGSLGIIHGVVSSPRLEGYLHNPIEIGEIGKKHAREILQSRISSYTNGNEYYLPLTENSFEILYRVLRGNIRSVLAHSDNYCLWASDRALPKSNDDKDLLFTTWLNDQAQSSFDSAKRSLRPRALKVFEAAVERVVFSPSDFEAFGFNSIPAFRPHVKELENAGALVSTQDEGDQRRKTIQVTPKGWLINHHINQTPA